MHLVPDTDCPSSSVILVSFCSASDGRSTPRERGVTVGCSREMNILIISPRKAEDHRATSSMCAKRAEGRNTTRPGKEGGWKRASSALG